MSKIGHRCVVGCEKSIMGIDSGAGFMIIYKWRWSDGQRSRRRDEGNVVGDSIDGGWNACRVGGILDNRPG